jgi:peptide/nickel transport system permease protein
LIARRLLLGLVTLLLVSVVVFVATQYLPGDAAQAVLGRSATPE